MLETILVDVIPFFEQRTKAIKDTLSILWMQMVDPKLRIFGEFFSRISKLGRNILTDESRGVVTVGLAGINHRWSGRDHKL
jgi:predicted nucleotide-binding protein (sugar kinase/HSP70/actin superfamily)